MARTETILNFPVISHFGLRDSTGLVNKVENLNGDKNFDSLSMGY